MRRSRAAAIAAMLASVACAARESRMARSEPVIRVRVLSCDEEAQKPVIGSGRMACAMAADARRDSERAATQVAAAKPDPSCRAWASMSEGARVELRHSWADAFGLSPETRWCLTNERTVEIRADAIDAACTNGAHGNPRASFDALIERCGAVPKE